jgi:PRC-barrel domain
MTDLTEAYTFQGRTLIDRDGDKIGKVDELYEDRDSGRPEWALVSTGLLGTKKSFVPLRGATAAGEDVHLPIEKAQVKDAPSIEPDGDLSEREEQRLFEHYGVDYSTAGTTTATDAEASGRGRDVPGRRPTTR